MSAPPGRVDDAPDDGLPYELDDGVLVVSPAPMVIHQVVLARLIAALVTACPAAGGGNRTTPAWRDPGCRRDRLVLGP
jgi:hypothetical protein